MRKSVSLKTHLAVLMIILVLLQSVAVVVSVMFSGTFDLLNEEEFKVMKSFASRRKTLLDDVMKEIVRTASSEAEILNDGIERCVKEYKLKSVELYKDDIAFEKATSIASKSVVNILNTTRATGAFVIFNRSNARKDLDTAHSAVYIRNGAPDLSDGIIQNYELVIGSVNLFRRYRMMSGPNWSLDLDFAKDKDKNLDYYYKPIDSITSTSQGVLEQHGYWSPPHSMIDDGIRTVTYTVPLADYQGRVYGVLGMEMSLSYVVTNFLFVDNMPYDNSFFLISHVDGDNMDLEWYIPSYSIPRNYLNKYGSLNIKPHNSSKDLYITKPEGLDEMYCVSEELTMYSKTSTYADEVWNLNTFAPTKWVNVSSVNMRNSMIISLGFITIVDFIVIFFISRLATLRMSGLTEQIKSLQPFQDFRFKRTGLREIDELMSKVESFNSGIINVSQSATRILELSSLPIGGFEMNVDTDHVIVTGYVQSLLKLEKGKTVQRTKWSSLFSKLIEKPLDSHDDVYEYYDEIEDRIMWLKIIENKGPRGSIGIVIEVTKDIEEQRRLAYEADHDSLTYLYNGSAFRREVTNWINAKPNSIGALIFIDLDDLKYTNDNYGHNVGDKLIKTAAKIFSGFTSLGGMVARISGDEFAIFIHGYSSVDELRSLIYKFFKERSHRTFFTPDGNVVKVRSSIGISWYPNDAKNVDDLIRLADYAMYEIKHSEKGGIREFDKHSYKENSYLLNKKESLNRLLEEGLIRFAFQPIICLKTGEIYGYEMLMRSKMEDFKSPKEILLVAARQAKLSLLERMVIFKAFKSIREYQEKINGRKLFINTIPSQALSESDIELLIRDYSDLFEQVVIEIIEAESDSPKNLENKIKFIRRLGMLLAVDDFGSGHSNETRILLIQPDIIKMDMELVQGVSDDNDKQSLILNFLTFCKSKGIKIVAEGVETAEDLRTIYKLGVDYVQGYYTGRPNLEVLELEEGIRRELKDLISNMGTNKKGLL